MKKGITVDRTALVAAAFRDAGILVHAYLMYGFPSETIQETVDSLERVRQLVAADLIQSAFWHRFTATAHSPVGLDPASHGLRIIGPEFQGFAENDLQHRDQTGETPQWLGEGLRRSMLNFLENRGLDMDVRNWFEQRAPKPRVSPQWVNRLLKNRFVEDNPQAERRVAWLGGQPVCASAGKKTRLLLSGPSGDCAITLDHQQARWLEDVIRQGTPHRGTTRPYPLLRDIQSTFPGGLPSFKAFIETPTWKKARAVGLLLV
jgi:hypothetical protein